MANPYIALIGVAEQVGKAAADKMREDRTHNAFGRLSPTSQDNGSVSFEVDASDDVPVPHQLGRIPDGYRIVAKNGEGDVYEASSRDDINFYFGSSAAAGSLITVTILPF